MKIYFILSIMTLGLSLVLLLVLGLFADHNVFMNALIYIDLMIVCAFLLGLLYMFTANKSKRS